MPERIDLHRDFNETHIEMVWDELYDRFGFDMAGWKSLFKEELLEQPRKVSKVEHFIHFGTVRINPILNDILQRGKLRPTFIDLVHYVIRKENKG